MDFDAKERFRGIDMAVAAREAQEAIENYGRTGVMPDFGEFDPDYSVPSDEERLKYYRAHGLDDCGDYPGGDAAFERDVLSGAEHDDDSGADPFDPDRLLKKEDAYIVLKMIDGTFAFDRGFAEFLGRRQVGTVFRAVAHKNGFSMRNYGVRTGWTPEYYADLLSGAYSRKILGMGDHG